MPEQGSVAVEVDMTSLNIESFHLQIQEVLSLGDIGVYQHLVKGSGVLDPLPPSAKWTRVIALNQSEGHVMHLLKAWAGNSLNSILQFRRPPAGETGTFVRFRVNDVVREALRKVMEIGNQISVVEQGQPKGYFVDKEVEAEESVPAEEEEEIPMNRRLADTFLAGTNRDRGQLISFRNIFSRIQESRDRSNYEFDRLRYEDMFREIAHTLNENGFRDIEVNDHGVHKTVRDKRANFTWIGTGVRAVLLEALELALSEVPKTAKREVRRDIQASSGEEPQIVVSEAEERPSFGDKEARIIQAEAGNISYAIEVTLAKDMEGALSAMRPGGREIQLRRIDISVGSLIRSLETSTDVPELSREALGILSDFPEETITTAFGNTKSYGIPNLIAFGLKYDGNTRTIVFEDPAKFASTCNYYQVLELRQYEWQEVRGIVFTQLIELFADALETVVSEGGYQDQEIVVDLDNVHREIKRYIRNGRKRSSFMVAVILSMAVNPMRYSVQYYHPRSYVFIRDAMNEIREQIQKIPDFDDKVRMHSYAIPSLAAELGLSIVTRTTWW